MGILVISDIDVLRNAVRFSTAQRAFAASMVMERAGQDITPQEAAYLCIEGLSHFVTATEDLLGWAQVLRQWKPEEPAKQLFSLLDSVQVRPRDENEILGFFKELKLSGLRELLRILPSSELAANALPAPEVESIDRALPHILEGWIRLAEVRVAKDRGLVTAFNKVKHMLLAFPDDGYIRLARIESGNTLSGLRVEISADYAIGRARQAVECQAVLHSTLGLILTANGLWEPTADWVIKASLTWGGVARTTGE